MTCAPSVSRPAFPHDFPCRSVLFPSNINEFQLGVLLGHVIQVGIICLLCSESDGSLKGVQLNSREHRVTAPVAQLWPHWYSYAGA